MSERLRFLSLITLLVFMGACSRPFLYGQKLETNPISKVYQSSPENTLAMAKKALESQGYVVQKEEGMSLETSWEPTRADSHYIAFFDRQDRGTVGAYHKLILTVSPEGEGSKVEIASRAKSIISKLKSTLVEERKVLKKIGDYTRSSDIQVTNVGLKE